MSLPEKIPQQPNVMSIAEEEKGLGGRWKRRVFARLVWQGMAPYEAFLKADYPVIGVNSNTGHREADAKLRAVQMANEAWCRDWGVSWSIDAKEQVASAVPEAIAVLVDGLRDRREGVPTSLAVRCAENLLDRGGVVRSQVVDRTETVTEETKDAKELIRIIKERLTALEAPVPRPPSLVIDVKKVTDGSEQ